MQRLFELSLDFMGLCIEGLNNKKKVVMSLIYLQF